MPTLLPDDALAAALADLPQWERRGDAIVRSVQSPSFLEAVDLVSAVARAAEDLDHHPDIDIRWRTVTYTLSTHSAGGITELDVELASTIDRLASH